MTSTTTNPFEQDDIIVVTKDIFLPDPAKRSQYKYCYSLLGTKPYLAKGSILKVIKADYYVSLQQDYNMMALLIHKNQQHDYKTSDLYMIIKADVDNGSVINRQKLRQLGIDQIIYETT